MKWFKVCLSIVFLAAIMTVPTGCGKPKVTELKGTGEAPPPAAGHAAAAKDINKKPDTK